MDASLYSRSLWAFATMTVRLYLFFLLSHLARFFVGVRSFWCHWRPVLRCFLARRRFAISVSLLCVQSGSWRVVLISNAFLYFDATKEISVYLAPTSSSQPTSCPHQIQSYWYICYVGMKPETFEITSTKLRRVDLVCLDRPRTSP